MNSFKKLLLLFPFLLFSVAKDMQAHFFINVQGLDEEERQTLAKGITDFCHCMASDETCNGGADILGMFIRDIYLGGLTLAIAGQDIQHVTKLIRLGILDKIGKIRADIPLKLAVATYGEAQLQIITLLLEAGVSVYAASNPLSFLAQSQGPPSSALAIAEKLVLQGANIDGYLRKTEDGKSYFINNPLMKAIEQKKWTLVNYLLQKGAQLDVPLFRLRTPLLHAVESCQVGTARFLLEQGAAVNHRDAKGNTVIFYSAHSPKGAYDRLVALLLSYHADLGVKNN